ncbi:uridine kinase [Candidatus Woesebacteria bacterium]|nr:uridine kinase [Candidatus Woesebacteria bacterium]
MKKTFILGICGGTGSGKTTLATTIHKRFAKSSILIPHDHYYRDQSHLTMEERVKTNYDHPDSLETSRMIDDITKLTQGKTVTIPTYDFTKHNRAKKTKTLSPAPLIIIEGILIFHEEALRNLMSLKVFVDVEEYIRLCRRIRRDVEERGRTLEMTTNQYLTLSGPMHHQFVEPSKKHADIIVPQGGYNKVAIESIVALIKERL